MAEIQPGAFIRAQLPPWMVAIAEDVYGPSDRWTWAHVTYIRRLLEQAVDASQLPDDDQPEAGR